VKDVCKLLTVFCNSSHTMLLRKACEHKLSRNSQDNYGRDSPDPKVTSEISSSVHPYIPPSISFASRP
jgi:hypothetical protein